ncbi:MAG: YbhB/YbcL family Raf kinase inhibitor-like protein [Aquabacterium sp.]|nr:YbhB/YbcL family Raf kinase inhibitor-like protein [Aquabacterium sp.]
MNILRNVIRTAAGAAIALTAQLASAEGLELTSPDVKVNEPIAATFVYNGFGCTGQNLSPALSWKNAPAGTKSFAIMVHDPDAPTGGAGFWHWVVLNLPASTTGLPRGAGTADGKALPAGVKQITTDFGTPGWGGPCPPQGSEPHMYYFTVYALKVDKLDLPANATASLAGFMINANALDRAVITALYSR